MKIIKAELEDASALLSTSIDILHSTETLERLTNHDRDTRKKSEERCGSSDSKETGKILSNRAPSASLRFKKTPAATSLTVAHV